MNTGKVNITVFDLTFIYHVHKGIW